jgi:hypothetical protein
MPVFLSSTNQVVEVVAKLEKDFLVSLKAQSEKAKSQLGFSIGGSINSLSLSTALAFTDGKSFSIGGGINLSNINLKNITKPKQLLSSLSTKSVNWKVNSSYSTSFGKIYVDAENGVPSIDLKAQIGNLNVSKLGENVQAAVTMETTKRLDSVAKSIYGSANFWWVLRTANIKNIQSPLSKIRAATQINIPSKEAALTQLKTKLGK